MAKMTNDGRQALAFGVGTIAIGGGLAWMYVPLGFLFLGVLLWLVAFAGPPDKGVKDDQANQTNDA